MTRTKGSGAEGERPKARARGKHLKNGCGSESGRGERKQTESRVRRTGREDTGNQVRRNGESQGSESGEGAPDKPLRGEDGKREERKKQRLSSRNRKWSGRKKAKAEGERPKAKA